MARRTRSRRVGSPRRQAASKIPEVIYANASPRSVSGVSMFEAQHQITAETVEHFFSEPDVVERAVAQLSEAGFEILQATEATVNIAGSRATYERAFNTRIVAEERPAVKEEGLVTTATFLECPDTPVPGLIATTGTAFEESIEGVALEVPRYYAAPSAFAPLKSYWHLRLPGDVSLGVNADRAHRAGVTGGGIRVAMIDSGWYKHPYFVNRGYRAAPVVLGPAAANPLKDEIGHGTGESANIFAVAPDALLLPVKMNFVNTLGAFNAAVALGPHIITCSWGSSIATGPLSAADQALAVAIAAAVAAGITVIFSAGNGQAGFPGQHPNVISAGGVFMNPDESLQASNYASGFMSTVYAGRRVPDLCGLVGQRPRAIYLMLPLEPGDQIDAGNAGNTHPNGDETPTNDGWAAFSGTSAAAPQLAGAAALVKQACNKLTPAEIKNILMTTARDVTTGTCNAVLGIHNGLPAGPGPDTATGNGLVDAHKAVMVAKVRCLPIITPGPPSPISPIVSPPPPQPVQPVQPIQPIRPIQPPIPESEAEASRAAIRPITITPIAPIRPIRPTPITPIRPIRPIRPTPIRPGPIQPIILPGPEQGGLASEAGSGPGAGAGPTLTAHDASVLEDLIVRSELDL